MKAIPSWPAVLAWIGEKRSHALPLTVIIIVMLWLPSATRSSGPPKTIVWKLTDPAKVGGYQSVVLGAPAPVHDATGTALSFNGIDQGIVLPVIPISGWPKFTVEVLFKPAADGPAAPRFIHFQDNEANRGTMELRITPAGQWYMDTFLKNGKTGKGLTLIDSLKLHACDQWYWAALVYNGRQMTHYVNGVKELEGEVDFVPMTTGQLSLGVRLNKVNWFKGLIREIRFHPDALQPKALRHR